MTSVLIGDAPRGGGHYGKGGVLFSNAKDALGKTPNDAHPIAVFPNAQYRCQAKAHNHNANRIFRIQGRGPDGTGALYIINGTGGSSGVSQIWGLAGMAGKMIHLDGDAAVGGNSWISYPSVTFNGHDLTFVSTGSESPCNAQNAFNGSATPTNYVVRGPYMANVREKDNVAAWSRNILVTYTGYIWNRTGAPVTWTLASSIKDPVTVTIDGSIVLSGAAAALASADVTLTPGPHAFEWRAWNGDDDSTGPHKPTNWANEFGFVYDPQGRGDVSTTNIVLATDNGDGALFTRYTNATERLPAFGTLAFDTGTTLNWNQSKLKQDDRGWIVRLDGDGKTLLLEYYAGTTFILR